MYVGQVFLPLPTAIEIIFFAPRYQSKLIYKHGYERVYTLAWLQLNQKFRTFNIEVYKTMKETNFILIRPPDRYLVLLLCRLIFTVSDAILAFDQISGNFHGQMVLFQVWKTTFVRP